MITLANVESNNWLMTAVQRDRLRKTEEKQAQKAAATGKPEIHLHKVIKTALNGLSVLRILLAAVSPGVRLYFTAKKKRKANV